MRYRGPVDILGTARQAWQRGDYDTARIWYQKAGYENAFHNDPNITEEIADFAGDDPLYQKVLSVIIENLEQREPILQSEFTSKMKQVLGEDAANLVRYVTYFAEIRGDLIREKKGRSYNLYLPEYDDYEEEEESFEERYDEEIIQEPEYKLLNDNQQKNKKHFWLWAGLGLLVYQLLKYIFK